MKMGDFGSKIYPKPPLNEEIGRENLERKTRADLLEKEKEKERLISPNIRFLFCYTSSDIFLREVSETLSF